MGYVAVCIVCITISPALAIKGQVYIHPLTSPISIHNQITASYSTATKYSHFIVSKQHATATMDPYSSEGGTTTAPQP